MKKRFSNTMPVLVIGALLIIASLIVVICYAVNSQGMVPVEGMIIDLRGLSPMVYYQMNGNHYSAWAGVGVPGYKLRARINILADPADPTRVINPAGTGFVACVLLGAGLLVVGFAFLAQYFITRTERRETRLRTVGVRKKGTVTRVYQDYRTSINGRSPWVVEAVCVHPRTGDKVGLINSQVWRTHLKAGDEVDVLFDPEDDNLHMMDIDCHKPPTTVVRTILHP
ncbi:MAG: hypothetical protein IKK21_10135 [Clostridia bacterium]|nr:hypothetical protein [Clostridia bacterium]